MHLGVNEPSRSTLSRCLVAVRSSPNVHVAEERRAEEPQMNMILFSRHHDASVGVTCRAKETDNVELKSVTC